MKPLEFSKHLKYFFKMQKVSIMNAAEYRVDMLMATLGAYGWLFLTLIFLNVIYSKVTTLGGFTFNELLVILGSGQIIFALNWAITPGSSSAYVTSVVKGTIDGILLKPLNTPFAICTQRSDIINLAPTIIASLAILVYGFIQSGSTTSIIQIVLFIFTIVVGWLLTVFTTLNIATLSFFVSDLSIFFSFFSDLHELQKYPATIYPKYFLYFFTFIFPVALLAYVPAFTLIKGVDLKLILTMCFVLFYFILFFTFLFKKGLKAYGSASS